MSEIIESLQNERIKKLCKLHTKKNRDETKQFLIEGEHLIDEALRANVVDKLFILKDLKNPFSDVIECIYVSQAVLNKLSTNQSNITMIAVCNQKSKELKRKNCGLLLDDIQDPGNMGTIIRTAVSFGYDFIVLSKKCVDIYNDKCIRSTQGAVFHIAIFQDDLIEKIKELKQENFKVFGTSLHEATNLKNIKKQNKFVIVLGNEGQGVSNDVLDVCDQKIFIEMENFESLNVGVAAGICMYELKNNH